MRLAPKAAAAVLFYREGIRAVGVDAIVERSGVAKRSLYRSFASRDALIAAFLADRNAGYWAWWDSVMRRHPDAPGEQLRAVIAAVAKRVASPEYRGCPFLNAATELPEPDHPARAVALANKREQRARLRALAKAIDVRDPQLLADQLLLLLEGAYSMGNTLAREGPPRALPAAAEALLEAALATGDARRDAHSKARAQIASAAPRRHATRRGLPP